MTELAISFLPENLRGTQQNGMMHIADWYATFTSMVGVNPWDQRSVQCNCQSI